MAYEKSVIERMKAGEDHIDRLDMSTVKYLWLSSPFFSRDKDSVPKFLRDVLILKNFSDNELRVLSQYLHTRSFSNGDHIFIQGEPGVGFYFILTGKVDIFVDDKIVEPESEGDLRYVISLSKGEYFGELALLQNNSIRTATATCMEPTTVLGLFKPDMEDMIKEKPVLAAKLLQSLSLIVTKRLFSLTSEVSHLKVQLAQYESKE